MLYDSVLTFKMSKMALNPFCDETLRSLFNLHHIVFRAGPVCSREFASHDD